MSASAILRWTASALDAAGILTARADWLDHAYLDRWNEALGLGERWSRAQA